MAVRAKFSVVSKVPAGDGGVTIYMAAVYSSDPNSENKAFSDATPSGMFHMHIANGKPAADQFEPGKQYYVDFTPAG